MNWQEHILIDPQILAGKPVIKGTRISVECIMGLLGEGWTETQILKNYPGLQTADIQACFQYASDLLHDEKVVPFAVA